MKKLINTFLCAAGLMYAGAGLASVTDGRVEIRAGMLVGQVADTDGVASFKGIPYAQPPVGPLRWKAPQPVKHWNSSRAATAYGPKCWAAAAFGGPVDATGVSEDCLYLNVWAAPAAGEKKPVMVFIHGGGFQFGSASDESLDGRSLAKKGVVVVTINYRLGVMGYLSTPELDQESRGQQSGMYGTLDQIAALKWVQQNIASFGGDANNVTLFGESAGAHSVGILMSSPLTRGLIHRAIGQSGAFWESENGDMKSKATAQKMAKAFTKKINANTLKELRAIPAIELQKATPWTFQIDPSVANFSPSVDGYVLPNSPYVQFQQGKQNDIPLLVGWNGNEGQMFISRALPHSTNEAFTQAASQIFGSENLDNFSKLYPATQADTLAKSAETLAGDQVISFQTWSWANVHKQTGQSPVYVYYFNQTSAYTPIPLHIADVSYVFGNFPAKKNIAANQQDRRLSDVMQTYWTHFARTGNPNRADLVNWPAYMGPGSQVMQLGNTIQASPEEGTARFEFLRKFRSNGTLVMGRP